MGRQAACGTGDGGSEGFHCSAWWGEAARNIFDAAPKSFNGGNVGLLEGLPGGGV